MEDFIFWQQALRVAGPEGAVIEAKLNEAPPGQDTRNRMQVALIYHRAGSSPWA